MYLVPSCTYTVINCTLLDCALINCTLKLLNVINCARHRGKVQNVFGFPRLASHKTFYTTFYYYYRVNTNAGEIGVWRG